MRTLVFCSVLRIVLFLSCFCSFAEISESFRSGCHFVPKRNQLRKRDIFHSTTPPSSSPLLEKYKPVEPKCALRILVTSGCFLSPVFQLLARRLLWGATNTFIERHYHHMHCHPPLGSCRGPAKSKSTFMIMEAASLEKNLEIFAHAP